MKAWILRDIAHVNYEEVDTPIPESKEVLIRVKKRRNLRLGHSEDL